MLAWLIITQLLGLLSLLPWLVISGLSFMAFDAGYSITAVVFVGLIWSYPLLPIICSIVAWVAYARGQTTTALVSTSIPLLLIAPLVLYLFFTSA